MTNRNESGDSGGSDDATHTTDGADSPSPANHRSRTDHSVEPDQVDGRPENGPGVTDRRKLLGVTAVGALSMTAGCAGFFDGGGELSDSFGSHDHSGAFGAPAELGTENPVSSITANDLEATSISSKDLVTERTPFVNVAAYGVVGDGETDDTSAFKEALDAAVPHGTLYIPPDFEVRLTDTVTAEFWEIGQPKNNLHRFKFLCEGVLAPESDIGHVIELVDAVGPYVFVNVENGGKNVQSDSLFYINGGRDGLFEGFGHNYNGRIFHFEETGTYSIGHLKTYKCGQSVAVFDAEPMGEIRDIFDISMSRAPEFHDSTDVCINQYENFQENGFTLKGVVFDNCLSVFIDRLLVGGNASTPPVEFRDCDNVFANAIHLGGFPELGGVFEDVKHSTFRIVCNQGSRGIRYTGDESRGNRFIVNATNTDERAVTVEESVSGGYHYFAGNVTDESALAFDIRTTDAEIHLDNVNAVGNEGGDLAVPETNNVHLSNCRIRDIDGSPKTIDGLGTAAAPTEHPDASKWSVGTRVLFEDTEDGTGNGLYVRLEDGQWFRYAGEKVGE